MAAGHRLDGARLADQRPFVLRLAAHLAALGHVLGGQAHGDVDVVGRPLRAVDGVVELERRPLAGARDSLDAGGDVRVALTGLDRVVGHARRLQRGRAEAVYRARGHVMVDASEQPCDAPDVVALLALAEAAAHHDVRDRALLDLGVALDDRAQGDRREVVRADGAERSLDCTAYGRADCIDDHYLGHSASS